MGVRRYYYTFTILDFVIFILVQLGDGRPVAAKLADGAPSFVANASLTNILVATTVGHIEHLSVATSLTRIKNSTYSSTVNSAQMSKSDSDTIVAVPTFVSIVVLLDNSVLRALAECAVPINKGPSPQKPVPVLVKDGSPAHCSKCLGLDNMLFIALVFAL
ncbi:hypothetical protein C0989_008480 [Termitomyces sp. Mn162]|nr:hypothetical protein C0989_008480 [Termitomyces sp. Mn162]